MSLSDTVGKFIEKQELFTTRDKLLLAISGGIDSMVMLDLLRIMGYSIHVAHVNYKLRDEDADLDERLVTQYCLEHNLPVHIHRVSPSEQTQIQKNNLQQVAREIRYRHFEEVASRHQLNYICTAHHQEDKVETFFLNLMRGSGLQGLRSIQSVYNQIRRPLLSISRQDIIQYAVTNDVPHRQDQSNLSDKYNRNFLRHQVLPTLKERWPQSISQIINSADHVGDSHALLSHLISASTHLWKAESEGHITIGPISKMRDIPGVSSLLYYLLKPYNISQDGLDTLIQTGMSTGSILVSPSHDVVVDRDYVLIKEHQKVSDISDLSIPSLGNYHYGENQKITLSQVDEYARGNNKMIQYIDEDRAKFPLHLRPWKHGDRMKPIGMKGQSKLISDILSDDKVDQLKKKSTLVLIDSNQKILWLIGHRLSETCKISDKTTDIIRLEITSRTYPT